MKHVRRILSICLAVVMMCSSALVVRGDDIPSDEEILKVKAEYWEKYSQLSEKIPEECTKIFSDILTFERDEDAYINITDVKWYTLDDAVLVSLDGGVKLTKTIVIDEWSGFPGMDYSKKTFLRVMILSRDSETPVSYCEFLNKYKSYDHDLNAFDYDTFVNAMNAEDSVSIEDMLIILPKDFDPEKHKIVFFWYIEKTDDTKAVSISEPVELVLSQDAVMGDGDFNKDGKIRLTDVSLMLRYIAKWNINKNEYSLEKGDVNFNEVIDIKDCAAVLKIIAGWQHVYYGYSVSLYKQMEKFQQEYANRKSGTLMNRDFIIESFFERGYCYAPNNLKRWIKADVWDARYMGLTYEKILSHYLELHFIYKALNWTQDDLSQYIYDSYNAKWRE